jgi:hypothetical protein
MSSQHCLLRFKSSVTYRRVDWEVVTDVSKESSVFIYKVKYSNKYPTLTILTKMKIFNSFECQNFLSAKIVHYK